MWSAVTPGYKVSNKAKSCEDEEPRKSKSKKGAKNQNDDNDFLRTCLKKHFYIQIIFVNKNIIFWPKIHDFFYLEYILSVTEPKKTVVVKSHVDVHTTESPKKFMLQLPILDRSDQAGSIVKGSGVLAADSPDGQIVSSEESVAGSGAPHWLSFITTVNNTNCSSSDKVDFENSDWLLASNQGI